MDKEFIEIKKECLKTLLRLYHNAHAGHIASSLSCLDILICLFFFKLRDQDKFILSKGHAAAALYTVLAQRGLLSSDLLETFYKDGTLLPAHPPCGFNILPKIIFGTGSLGHGLSLANGIALAASLTGKNFAVYTVLSDGDCNEGSTWEAALFAGHHRLGNLTVIVDHNKLQGFGRTEEVLDLGLLENKWREFKFNVRVVENGHSFSDLLSALPEQAADNREKPTCIIAHTTKGAGISFMANRLEWHYLPMTEEQYQQALQEVELAYA